MQPALPAEPAHAEAGADQAALREDFPAQAHAAQAARSAPESNDIEFEDDDPLPLSDDAVLEAMGYSDVLDQAIGRDIGSQQGLRRDAWLTAMLPRQFADFAFSVGMNL